MRAERPEMTLVRETLETVVAPRLASALILTALEVHGPAPTGASEAQSFVGGALRDALVARLGDGADSIVEQCLRALQVGAGSRDPKTASTLPPTREIPRDDTPVVVFVVAATDTLASRLQASLGVHRAVFVATATIESLVLQLELSAPQVVLVDAADFASIEVDGLARTLDALAPSCVRGIWGADLPYGAALLRELRSRRSRATPLDRREGIEPLLDLVRSRAS